MKEEIFSINPLEQNTINLFGPINTPKAEEIINMLQYLDAKFKREGVPSSKRIITMQINSPGGSVSDGLAIYDTMNYIDAKIETIALGMVASMGAFLLSAGTRGLRKATPNSEILIHQPLGGAHGQASDIIIAADHIKRTRTRLNTILSENTGKPLEIIERDTDRDYIMTAEQALEYGLIDSIIPVQNKAKRRK